MRCFGQSFKCSPKTYELNAKLSSKVDGSNVKIVQANPKNSAVSSTLKPANLSQKWNKRTVHPPN